MADTTGYTYFAIKTADERLNLAEFNKLLTITPTRFQKMHERGQVPKCTIWEYSSGKLVNPYFYEKIEKLVEKLLPHKDEFVKLKQLHPDIEFVLEVVIYLGNETPGLNFSKKTIDFVNSVGGVIDCDIYNSNI